MKTKQLLRILIIQIIILVLSPITLASASIKPQPVQAPPFSGSDVIAAINTYRTQNGLSALSTNSLLNSLAKNQADYQASIESVTHTGPDGSTPQQRASVAGYGNGSGFYFSEIIYGGYNATVSDAMTWWKNSSTHNYYILQATYVEIGAAVTTSGNMTYFTAELAGPYGGESSSGSETDNNDSSGSSVGATIPANLVMPVQKSPPNADGSITHKVTEGQTLWTIAAVYEIDLDTLLKLNGLNSYSLVFPGDEIMIQPSGTSPTATITPETTSMTAPSGSSGKVLGTPVAYGNSPQYTNTPIVVKVPTKVSQIEENDTQTNGNLFSENKTIRIIVIIALVCLVIVILGSIFLQAPPSG